MKELEAEKLLESILDEKSQVDIRICGISKITSKWFIAERVIEEHLLYFVDSGQVLGEVGGKEVVLKAHSLLWIQPQVKHRFKPDGKAKNTVVYYLRIKLLSDGLLSLAGMSFLYVEEFSHLKTHFYEVILNSQDNNIFRSVQLKAGIVTLLSDILKEPQQKNVFKDGLKRYQVHQLSRYMNQHIDDRISSKEMSELLGMNMDYFSRQFKKTFLLSPREYIMQLRIRKAASYLLETNMNINEIANILKYPDVYQFSHQFKKVFGKSPLQYRKAH